MIYNIYTYGSPILRKQADPVPADYPDLSQLAEDMFETMYKASGVGLAAPQIGKSIRMFVVDINVYADENPRYEGFKKVFVNPEIYEVSEEECVMGEGCLSIPGFNEDVQRPEAIRIRWTDELGQAHDETFDGFAARVIQHEYDHLDGEMFVDKISPIRKTLIRSKLGSLAKGKFSASYKTKLG